MSRPLARAAARLLGREEPLEDLVADRFGNALAGVLDLDLDPVAVLPRADRDAPLRRAGRDLLLFRSITSPSCGRMNRSSRRFASTLYWRIFAASRRTWCMVRDRRVTARVTRATR
jgi:hypothetical protein